MAVAASSRPRVSVDGKFFRLGEKKFYVKGVAYGPFPPNAAGQPFGTPDQTAQDFAQIVELGANLIRVYDVPPQWLLDLAGDQGLKVFVDIPWNKQLCFLDSREYRAAARDAVRHAVYACSRHPAVFAFSVANEIPPDIVRWSGTGAVADFIDELIQEAKRVDRDCLCTFTNFPPTEFLRPLSVDFVCFNVYLHQEQPFRNYLARLQMLAESKPLILGEFGIDSIREGEARKCEMLRWQVRDAFRCGLAGAVVFSYTDEWFKDSRLVEGWEMGLTTSDRTPKESFGAVQKVFREAPYFPLPRYPKVSVVVASYNGERTLKACLDSLQRLNYPDYEVILVDDGSTDTTSQIARLHTNIRYLRHEKNLGLSVARNTGIAAATGEIIAFTDSDCRADPDWLYYLVGDLLNSEFAGIGGPNLLPPEDSAVAAAVMVSPGGPAHVMLTDRQAEHIPGCNMAFYKWALVEIGGFDPIFHQAGDDVDLCWRLQQAGYEIGFSPAGFVWHYRRSTLGAYLKQQKGYGEAEAMLVRKHPEYFNSFGGSIWRGRIYTASKFGVLVRPPIIYRGLFGSGGFQSLYASQPALTLMLCTTVEYHVLVSVPLLVLSVAFRQLLPLAITSVLISIAVCAAAAAQATLPRNKTRWWSRPLVAALFFMQPIVRGLARYQGRLTLRPTPLAAQQTLDSIALRDTRGPLQEARYWAEQPISRLGFVSDLLNRLDHQSWPNKSDIGWSHYDVEIYGSRWSYLQLTTVAEEHPPNKQLIRCRLRSGWSLPAKVVFWSLCGFELLVLGFAGSWLTWWLWVLLLTPLPLLIWFLRHEQRTLQSMIVLLLDTIAKEWNLAKVTAKSETRKVEKPEPSPSLAKSPFKRTEETL
jgi:glycosyltransferase involved in cell wall biosynthesis